MADDQPALGASSAEIFKVGPNDLASVVSSDSSDVYAAVLATSRLVAWMEIVRARVLVPYLSPGQLSVGVRVDITHSAATPPGEDVSITSTFVGKAGKVFTFDVVATDAGGEISRAKHMRAIINEQRLIDGTKKRMNSRSKI